jgi:hypothetical protein
LSSTASAQEKWTHQDGHSIQLELVRKTLKDGVLFGEFKDKDGSILTIKESDLVAADAARLKEFKNPAVNQEFTLIEAAIAKLREGKELTKEEIERCEAERQVFYEKLSKKNGTGDNTEFAANDQCDCYILMIKMSLINFKNHGGWPFRSTLRLMVSEELVKRAEQTNDPFIHFCLIFPCLSQNDVKHAAASYKSIQKSDPFLAGIATKWAKERLRDSETKTEFMKSAGIE